MIGSFKDFIFENSKNKDSAGIAIVYKDSVLLVHPTNGGWKRPNLGIPKGKIEPGEDLIEAAIRETAEETGIFIKPDQLNKSVNTIEVYSNQKYQKSIHYFICEISDLSEIGLDSIRVPKQQLQLEEIDWAGFVKINEAYHKIHRNQLILLDRLN
jgi:8-oxo-dGTP pyrophosphatase MutT (NUDIX family)